MRATHSSLYWRRRDRAAIFIIQSVYEITDLNMINGGRLWKRETPLDNIILHLSHPSSRRAKQAAVKEMTDAPASAPRTKEEQQQRENEGHLSKSCKTEKPKSNLMSAAVYLNNGALKCKMYSTDACRIRLIVFEQSWIYLLEIALKSPKTTIHVHMCIYTATLCY